VSYAPPDLRLRAAIELEKRRRAGTVVPSMTFRGAANIAQSIATHEWMLAGPAETGKTVAAMWRLDTLLKTQPHSKYTLVRKVAADIVPTVLQTYLRMVEFSRSRAVPYGGSQPQWFDYPNGARLYLAGMDRPEKVLSGERDGFCVNQAEELTLDDWELMTTRATGRGAVTKTPMVFGDCNPGAPNHWIINRPSLQVLYSRHEDNPTLFDEHGVITEQGTRTMAVLDALTGIRHKRLRLGLWVAAEGVVYEEFDRSLHLIDRFSIPKEWRRFRVVDFGFTNPLVCQWWAIDHDNRMYRYREIYRTQTIVEDHAKEINRLSEGEFIEATVCDHDAQERATLERYGIPTMGADKSVITGIQAVKDRMVRLRDGKPHIFLLRDSLVSADQSLLDAKKPTCTEQEIESYMWHKSQDGKPNKEEPVKLDDHGCDALRYGVMYVDSMVGGVRPRRRRAA
jgi:PBSX family phage terminase large subunit